jgi:hypothetical protein
METKERVKMVEKICQIFKTSKKMANGDLEWQPLNL